METSSANAREEARRLVAGFVRDTCHEARSEPGLFSLDEDRVEAPNRARAREALLEHERRLGILAQVERRVGPTLPPGTAEYFYGLMLRWQALFEEHGYPLHQDLASWRKERGELGI